MSERITFIHSGDIHLGAPFRGLRGLSSKWAERLVQAIPEAYDRVIDAAIERGVDFVLFAGDVFDTDKPSYAHHRHFLRGLERLREVGIPVYLIAGNHDPYATWAGLRDQLPENVHMFGSDAPSYAVYERDGAAAAIIAARGFSNQSSGDIAAGMTRAAAQAACATEAPFVIGMLHTGLWLDPYKAPTSEDALYASGMDYWALGHIHKNFRFPQSESAETKLAYCGCVQGRDIKETGERGCYAVTLEQGIPNQVEFIPCASVEWEKLRVDVSKCPGAEDVLGACVRAMFDANAQVPCEEMIARVTLVGATPLHGTLARPGYVEELRDELNERYPSFFCDALIDETTTPFDKDAMRASGLFEATLLRESEKLAANSDATIEYLQQEFAARGLTLPAGIERKLGDLIERAEDLSLELLEGREEL